MSGSVIERKLGKPWEELVAKVTGVMTERGLVVARAAGDRSAPPIVSEIDRVWSDEDVSQALAGEELVLPGVGHMPMSTTSTPVPVSGVQVPTLQPWALALFGLILAAAGLLFMKKK